MVVTTHMFHKITNPEPTIQDIERVDSELRGKSSHEISSKVT